MKWKRLNRNTLLDTKFLKVYADKVELPNGDIIEDYTVVEKPDFVMVIATDQSGNLIALREYKYAVDETLNTLPAGHIEKNESPLESAKRELEEETGYISDSWEELGYFYDYATKDCHKAFFVKACNAKKKGTIKHENTESITIRLIPIEQLKKEVKAGEWKANVTLATFVMAGIYS